MCCQSQMLDNSLFVLSYIILIGSKLFFFFSEFVAYLHQVIYNKKNNCYYMPIIIFCLILPILVTYITNRQSLKGLRRTFVLPTNPHFCEHIFWQSPKGFTKFESCIIYGWSVTLWLVWIKYVQICHFPGKIIEFTALKIGHYIS